MSLVIEEDSKEEMLWCYDAMKAEKEIEGEGMEVVMYERPSARMRQGSKSNPCKSQTVIPKAIISCL